ncbi:hypothetical protein B0T26DRAFT_746918 [Lasiosphaeria miniovina]|uniref:Rhodopsin domain-containing protein n=1 Tax=Lasiosphaeria miniovina TaxID=1954250 RepID=A0AA40EF06_9PEZI|nr:uncharacterized protein B0T26DRAFT_746918 [Lasiosphaeria miniovina]KAK0735096.1 hypothetical protein B0T26DRAFT_746918 [Lasiosphaeria miniovina]
MANPVANGVILAATISPVPAIILVCLRFFTARRILHVIHKDDWLILAAMVLSIGFSISECIQTRYGLGEHLPNVPESTITAYMLIGAWPTPITSYLATLFTKASILYFYLRFSTSRLFASAIYFVLFVVVGYCVLGATTALYACQPIAKFWIMSLEGNCIGASPIYTTLIALNVFTDGILLLLPFWILLPLKIALYQRLAIAGCLGAGGFVLAVSIYRLDIVLEGFNDPDFTYRHGINFMWSLIETNVAIVCACLPCLRAFVGYFWPSIFRIRNEPRALSSVSVSQPRRQPVGIASEEKSSNASISPIGPGWNRRGSERGQARSPGGEQAV